MCLRQVQVIALAILFGVVAIDVASAQLVTSITNNRLWLDGADMNDNGAFDAGVGTGAIAQWNDRSGNGFHVTPPVTAGNTPLQAFAEQNGLSTARFDQGTADKLDNTAFNVSNAYTVLTVARSTTTAGTGHVLSGINDNLTDSVLYRNGTSYRFYSGVATGNTDLQVANTADTANFHLFGYRINNVLGANDFGYFDGVSTAALEFNGSANLNGIRIGNLDRATPSNITQPEAWSGDIAEVIVYNKLLNTAERRVLENHLSAKWNSASLGANERFTFDTTSNQDFGVIGIGREADGALTSSSDLGLTIAEANGSLGVGEYVMAGTNDTTNSVVTTQLPSNITARMERVWAIEETGDVDINLTFDFIDAGLAFPDDMQFSLLQSVTENGTFMPLEITPTISNGDQVTFTLPGSQYSSGFYTIGMTQIPEPATWMTFAAVGGVVCLFLRLRRRK